MLTDDEALCREMAAELAKACVDVCVCMCGRACAHAFSLPLVLVCPVVYLLSARTHVFIDVAGV